MFTPASQRVTHCTDARTGRHLATFSRRPGSSLYTLTVESPPTAASGPVAASGQVLAAVSRSGPESAPCSCRLLSHETLLWHHRLGHPSLPRLRSMASRVLVSGLPPSLPPLPSGPGPSCVPCVEGRLRATPHSSHFPPTVAPLQTLHMDVWGPAPVRGQGYERYFLLVVDDYSRYTTVLPLRSKGAVTEVLIDWIREARLQLRKSFGSDFPVLRLHSDRGGEFSSRLLRDYCRARGIRQTFTLLDSPQQNGIAERRIGMVMDVARTSMIHAAAPHFLWPFAVRYAAHQINLHPRVSSPETSPALLWTGKVGDASAFRVWGSRAFVRDLSADKLSPRAAPCVFLGFPTDAPGWQFYHPSSRRVLSSQDVRFDESVPFYRLFPYRTPSLPPPPDFLVPVPPPVDPLPPPVPAPSGVSQVDAVAPVEVTGDSGAAAGAEPWGADCGGAVRGGAEPGGATAGGAGPEGATAEGAEPGGAEPGGAVPGDAGSGGAGSGAAEPGVSPPAASRREPLSPQELREWFARRWRRAAESGGAAGAGAGASSTVEGAGAAGPGAAGPAGPPGAGAAEGFGAEPTAVGPPAGGVGGPGTVAEGAGAVPAESGAAARPLPYFVPLLQQVLGLSPPVESPPPAQSQSLLEPSSPLPAPSPYTGPTGGLAERREPASRPASPVRAARAGGRSSRQRPPPVPGTHRMSLRPSTAALRAPLPSPPASSLPALANPESDSLRAASPAVPRLLATVVTDPSFESAAASALVAELVDFAARCRLDYAAGLVAESASVCPPFVGGECALGTDVLEDRQEELQCLAAASPHLASVLLAPEGDPDALDIPTPRSYAEAVEGPYSSKWQAAMDAEMASWKSTGTYVDEVPPPGANIVSGMWIFRVKRPPGSPPVFKARYVARGFSQRQGVDYFQTFSPTPKMTTLRANTADVFTKALAPSCSPLLYLTGLPPYVSHPTNPTAAPTAPMASPPVLVFDAEGRLVKFDTWLDNLHLYLQLTAKDDISLYDHARGHVTAPATTADSTTRSQWQTRDAHARFAIRNSLPIDEREHFGQHKTAQALYTAVIARYSSPASAALGRLSLPYLFPDLASFHTVADLITHLRTSEARFRAAMPDEFLAKNPPPLWLTLYHLVTRLPDTLRSVKDHFLARCPTELTIALLKKELLAAEASIVAAGASRGDLRTPFFEGCSPSPLLPSFASAAAVDLLGAEKVGTVSASSGRRSGRGKGGKGGGGDGRGGGGGGGGGDFDAILTAMYVMSTSGEGAEYLCVPPDPGIRTSASATPGTRVSATPGAGEAVALGACASAPPGTESTTALHTFTLDSGASRCFFRDRTALEPLARPVAVSLADPSGGPVIATSTVIPLGTLSGLHIPSFSTNLVEGCALQDGGVHQFTPAYKRVTHCTCARTGRHLATFTRQPGSDLYTLTTESPQVAASASASASGQLSAPCSCRSLAHETVLWHHRLGHPVLSPLPPSRAPPYLPCVEGRQRAAPHSSLFPPTTAPLQTLHMDVWGPARVRGQGQERYFLIVVDDYSRYTTVFPLRTKGEVPDFLIPWIRRARLQLSECFHSDLHSDRGGEFSSHLLAAYCAEHGIEQSFTLPASPHQNGIANRRIGLVMEVARTSMIHAAAPHSLWPFAVRYAAHQLNIWPRVSLPDTSPTLLWTREVGDASRFRVWGSRAFVRDTFADKLSSRAIPCVFLGFVLDPPGWHPSPTTASSPTALPRPPLPPPLFLAPGAAIVDPLPPQGAAPSGVSQVDPVEPVEVAVNSRPAADAEPRGAKPGDAEPGGAEPGGAETGGAEPGGVEPGGTERGGAEPQSPERGTSGARRTTGTGTSASPPTRELPSRERIREWYERRCTLRSGAPGVARPAAAGGAAGAGGSTGAAGAAALEVGAAARAEDPGAGAAAGAEDPGVGAAAGAEDPGAGVSTGSGVAARPRPYFVPLLQQVLGQLPPPCPPPSLGCPPSVQLQSQLPSASSLLGPAPYTGPTGGLTERREPESRPASPESRRASPVHAALSGSRVPRQCLPAVLGTHRMALLSLHAAGPTVTRLLATVVTDPSFESTAASALVGELVDFAATCRLDYAASLVAESASVCPPSVGGECALGTDVLEDRQEELQCLAAASPHLASVLLAPEGDPDALDIPTPRSYAEAVEGPYSSQWQAAMDAEMASWKTTGTYVDGVPPPGANIVSGMWIFRVKRPPGSPPVFKARYVARGFSQRQGVDYFQTFSPTPKMTTLRVLLHIAAQRDYELHSLDFSTAFLQGSLHEEIWLRRGRMTCTRPDLAYPLSILARYVAPGRHRPEHMAAAKRVLRYLCSTSGMGLVLGGRSPVVLTGHADASWADDQATQRSSSCEAEIYAGAMAAQELHWLTYLLTDLGEPPRSPPVLYVDNKAMLALCREQRLEHRTKHIALRYFLARELQQRGQLRLAYVASEANTADVFTKALAPCDHQRFCTQLGLVPVLPHLLSS
ncbi:unnamed protein product [Closterium sp. NIES-53]